MEIEELWKQFGQQLRQFIAARVSDPDVVDELTQQLLIKVHQNLHRVKERERIAAWLFRIARNVVHDYYRSRGRAAQAVDIETLESSLQQPEPDDSILEALSHCIRSFVDQSSERYRQTIIAVDLEGQSQKAVADARSVSHSTIKSQTQRGRAQLLQLFNRCCDFTLDVRGGVVDYVPKSCACDIRCESP